MTKPIDNPTPINKLRWMEEFHKVLPSPPLTPKYIIQSQWLVTIVLGNTSAIHIVSEET